MSDFADKVSKKVLLIEDEFYIRELYKNVLNEANIEVDCALDGEEGIEKAKLKPALILLDIMLPVTNGIDVLRKLKAEKETKDIPVVLISNLGQEEVIKKTLELGAVGYFMKVHLKPVELVKQVKSFLEDPSYKMKTTIIDRD